MTNFIQRDLKKRKLYAKHELKRIEFKSIIQDLKIPKEFDFNLC